MRNYLHLILLLLAVNLVAQTDDDCTAAFGTLAGAMSGTIFNNDNTGYSDEGNYTSSILTSPISGFTGITWNDPTGYYSIMATSGSTGDWSVALSPGGAGDECTITASEELFTGALSSSATEISCFYLVNGESYIIAFATESGDEGTIDLEFGSSSSPPPTNSDCATAEDQGSIITNCEPNNITGDFTDACPNPDEVMCLDLGTSAVLWYSFTTDAIASEVTIETNASVITPQFALLEGVGGCGSLSLVGSCQEDGVETFTVSANTQYWVAVGEENIGAGGSFSLDITASFTPQGDDCGIEDLGTVTTTGVSAMGTTTCASAPTSAFCAVDHAVYYEFEISGSVNVDLDVTLASDVSTTGTAASDLGFEIYLVGCADTSPVPAWAATGGCTGFGTTMLECVPPGNYTIAIGSVSMSTGDFEVTLSQSVSGPPNDACANADASVVLTDNCTPVTLSGTTVNACPESFTGPACPYDTESVVWHEISLPTNAIGIEISMISGAAVTVFTDNNCPIPANFFTTADCVTSDVTVSNLTGGDSYLIGVSTDATAEGAYSFDVLAIVPPDNDVCGSAIMLSDAFPMSGTNNCATADVQICTLDATTSHVVWYQYVVTGSVSTGLNVNVSADGGSTTPMTGVSVQLVDECGGDVINEASNAGADCNNPLGIDIEYECIAANSTVWIAVGSNDTEEGDFTITVSQVDAAPTNDACDMATPIDLSAFPCMINSVVNETNQFACPEMSDLGTSCAYSTDAVVWYSVTLPSDAVGLEISNLTPNFYATYFSGACGAIAADGDCFTDAGNSSLTYSAGTTLLIAIGSTTANEGMFSFDILPVVPPSNDLCAVDVEQLSNGATTSGTNNCATPADVCSLNDMTSHVVWYEYTVSGTVNTGLEIVISPDAANNTAISSVSVEVSEGCGGAVITEATDSDCTAPLGTTLRYECIAGGTTIKIAVGSEDTEEGDFTITVTEVEPGPINDECNAATDIDLNNVACTNVTVAAGQTNEFACPEMSDLGTSCAYGTDPVVWYSVTLPTGAVGLEISNLTPNFYATYFSGACGALSADGDCFTDAGNSSLTYSAGTTLLIAVGSTTADEGMFTFDILPVVPADNDICNPDAETLASGTAAEGTTACATPDGNVCSLSATTSHVVYYTYTVTATTNTDLTIVTSSSTATSGTAAVDLVTAVWTDCSGTDFTVDPDEGATAECDGTVDQTLTYQCVPPGTVLTIAVGSTDNNEGDFSITVTEDADGVMTASNDVCNAPIDLDVSNPCEWLDFSVSSLNACPEGFDIGGCGFADFPITWYSFTTPAGAVSVEIEIVTVSAGTPIYAIFENDCPTVTSTPTNVSNCETGFGVIANPVDVNASTTYLLGIGSNDAAGADIDIRIKINVPPANDEPCDAEPLTAGTNTDGTNVCATVDYQNPSCTDQSASSVWYSYTLQAGETGVEITFTNAATDGTTGPVSIMVVDACSDPVTEIDPNVNECNAETLTEPMVLNCLDANEEIWIQVSTEDEFSGDFQIQLDPIIPDPNCIDNDVCDMLGGGADQGVIVTDDDCTIISDCNANACAELIGDCGVTINNVVWYSVTNDGVGEFITASIENATFDDPVIAIFSDCPATTQIGTCEFGAGGEATAGPFMIPMDGSQYWIAVGSEGAIGGDFDLCIEISSGCVNDCDPFALENGVTEINPASTTGCTEDNLNPDCPNSSASSVWYSFTVPPGFSSFEVIINNINITGDVGIAVGPYVAGQDCNDIDPGDILESSCGDLELTVPCTPEGTEYYIQISSGKDMDEGDFEITVNGIAPLVPNDLCSGIGPDDIFDITEDDYCMFVVKQVETQDACPEIFTASACDFTLGPTVWYEVTIPNIDGVEAMDVLADNFNGFAGNLQVAIVQVTDCADIIGTGTAIDCDSGNADFEISDVMVTPGETYQIVVGSDTAEDFGEVNISIKIEVPPINDNPCPNDVNPPFDLSGGVSHSGTTCCARGANDDPSFDFANQECSGATDDDVVWYTYTPDGSGDGIYIDVVGSGGSDGIMGNTTVEVYSTTDPNGGCTGALTLEASSCTAVTPAINIPVALCDPDLLYYIKVGSADDDCGDFTISVNEKPTDCAADECPDAEVLVTQTPEGCEDGENILSISSCLEFACPEDVNVACMSDEGPTVWFQIDIDSPDATILVTQVEADGFEVMWSIWQSTTGSCDDMINVSQPQPSPEPAIPCGTDDNFVIPIVQDPPGTPATYWIAITAVGEITDPSFTLNYAGSLGCIACSGNDAFDCDNGEFTASIDGEEVEEEDFQNFCPGQEVEVCLEFNYNTAGTGNDWLHGIIPTFGEGWDLEASDIANADLGGGWEWIDADGPCATTTSIYTLPNLCTYTNDDGVLQLCNTACNPNCPCDGPLEPSSPLPSGWFWSSNGGSTTCVNGSCIPLEQYGVPGGVNVDVDVCFDMVVKSFADLDGDGVPDEDCELNKDLRIVFQTTSDAVTGCWEDNPCIIDPSLTGPAWEVNCDVPPNVIGDNAEICNMDMLDIDVTTEDGSAVDIVVEVDPNPGVDGETDFNFTGGFGTIDNTLTNTSGSVEVVVYNVYSVDPTKPCPGITNQIEVTVYPELEISFNDPLVVCDGLSTTIIATPNGGNGNYVTYQWGAPGSETTPSITVTPVTTTTYVVTVTDELGCTGSGEVEVFWNPPVEFELVPSMESVCQNGVEEELLNINVEFTSGTPNYNINWDVSPQFGLDYWLGNNPNSNGVLTVYEETSDPGQYTVFVDVEDANGCIASEEIEILIGGAPFFLPFTPDIPCGGSGETIDIVANAVATVGPPVTMIGLYDCEGILIFENMGNSATWPVDPNEYNCVVVIATDANGCMASVEYQLDSNDGPEPSLTGSSHCIGETSSVSVDNPELYTDFVWNTGPPMSTITADMDETFIYVVTVTDAEGCTGVASYEVEVEENPTILLSGSLSYCAGSSTTLTASGGTSYVWTQLPATEVSTTAEVTIMSPGDYNVEVTNAEGCVSDSTITIIEDTNLLVTLDVPSLCDNDTGTLSAGDSPGITYEWENADGDNLGSTFSIEVGGGTYCVTVTDTAAGCTGSTCATITPNVSPMVMVTDTTEICRADVGLAPGVLLDFNAQVSGGVSGVWVNLDNIGGVNFLDDLAAVDFTDISLGIYAFEFRTDTAMDPCEEARDTMYVDVINCTCPSVDVLMPPTLCNTQGDIFDLDDLKNTNEDVTWTSTGANIVTIFDDTMVDVSGLSAGTYEFTLTLVNPVGGNCPETNVASFVIVEEAIAEANDAMVCNADTGNGSTEIDLNTTLSSMTTTPGIWTDANGDVVSNMFDGNMLPANTMVEFTYTVTGDAPCGDISTDVTITVIDCNCPQVTIDDPDPLCNDGDSIDLDDHITTSEPGTWVYVSGGTTGTVVLEAGNIFNTNDGVTQLTSGLYVFNYVFDTDPGGDCENEFPINIIVSNQPEVTAVAASPCNVMSSSGSTFVDLTQQISGDVSNGTWAAEPGSEAIDISDPSNVDFDGQAINSVWQFTFTAVAIAPCMPASATVIVTVSDCACPNIDVLEPMDLCNSQTGVFDLATLEGPMIGEGNWTVADPSGMPVSLGGAMGTELSVDGVSAGDYLLTYTLDPAPAANCQPDSTVVLSVFAQNFATLADDTEVCVNDGSNGANFIDFTSLIVAGATDGTWADTDGAGVDLVTDLSNVSFEGVDADMAFTFTYTVTSDAPCMDESYTIEINTKPCDCPLAIPLPIDPECSDVGVVDLSQYNNALFAGTWSSTDLTVTDNTIDLSMVASGTYTLFYTMDDPVDGCPDTWETSIDVSTPSNPGTPEAALLFCEDESDNVDLSLLLTDEDAGGVWMETSTVMSTGGAFNVDGTFDITGQAPGSYTFSYSIVGEAPCADVSESVEVVIEAVPNADAGMDQLIDCVVTEVMIGGNGSSTGANFTYTWTELGGAQIMNSDMSQVTVSVAGTYTLTVENTETGCTNSDEVIVTVSDDVPSFELDVEQISCNGAGDGSITIINQMGGNGDYSYSFNGGTFGTQTSFTNLQGGTYTIVMEDSSGSGCQYEQEVTIINPDLLILDLGPPVQTNLGNEVSFSIEDQLGDFVIDNIVWTVDGVEICSDPTCVSITIEAEQNANVNVEVTYNNGCIAEDMTQILVTQVVDVILPNVFSPNNDGNNEVFYVNSDDVETVLSMRIFDRWGELVFASENAPASDPSYGWDGSFKGQPVNPGVFVYVVEVLFVNGTKEQISGDLTIIR